MAEHAKLSPSGAHRWMRCPGSVSLEANEPDSTSAFSEEGTLAHALAACVLSGENEKFYGEALFYLDHGEYKTARITKEMADYVQIYVDAVRQRMDEYALAGFKSIELHVEQRVPIGHITGEADAFGTADVIITADDVIDCWDLKYGRGVAVEAEGNEQGMMYALGAIEKFKDREFSRARLTIHQPRIATLPNEWEIPVAGLVEFGLNAMDAAQRTKNADPKFVTGEKQCRFCKAKATCPSLDSEVRRVIEMDFADVTEVNPPVVEGIVSLTDKMASITLIEGWCKAVRGKVESELFAGNGVPGYKLVQGKQGNRGWENDEDAEKLLKSFRLKVNEMYDFKLISPTNAEKVLKQSSPKRWMKALQLVTRSDGKPSVAPDSDKRPALVIAPVTDDFAVEIDVSDLI